LSVIIGPAKVKSSTIGVVDPISFVDTSVYSIDPPATIHQIDPDLAFPDPSYIAYSTNADLYMLESTVKIGFTPTDIELDVTVVCNSVSPDNPVKSIVPVTPNSNVTGSYVRSDKAFAVEVDPPFADNIR
jgi:hypothetical protein